MSTYNPLTLEQRPYEEPVSHGRLGMAEQKAIIAALYAEGRSYQSIADHINDNYDLPRKLTASTISGRIQTMIRFWKEKQSAHIEERTALIMARLDQIDALAAEAYFASMEGKKTTKTEREIKTLRTKASNENVLKKGIAERKDIMEFNRTADPNEQIEIDFGDLSGQEGVIESTFERIKEFEQFEETPAGDPRFLTIMLDVTKQRRDLLKLGVKSNEDPDAGMSRLSDNERISKIKALVGNVASRAIAQQSALAPAAPLGGFAAGKQPEGIPDKLEVHVTVPVKEVEWDLEEDDWDE